MWSEEDNAGADDGVGDDILVLGDEGEAALGAGEGVLEEEEGAAVVDLVERAGPITCRNPKDVSVSARDRA